jgi:hypothetical protein
MNMHAAGSMSQTTTCGQKLARLSALDISIARFDYDEARLAAVIRNALTTTAAGRAELAG